MAFIGTCTTDATLLPIEASNANPVSAFRAVIGLTGREVATTLLSDEYFPPVPSVDEVDGVDER